MDDLDKAQWILENGKPILKWVYERVDNIVYRRPTNMKGPLPPWVSSERQEYYKTDDSGGDYVIYTPHIPNIHIGEKQ
jgi:hypothetical protein